MSWTIELKWVILYRPCGWPAGCLDGKALSNSDVKAKGSPFRSFPGSQQTAPTIATGGDEVPIPGAPGTSRSLWGRKKL